MNWLYTGLIRVGNTEGCPNQMSILWFDTLEILEIFFNPFNRIKGISQMLIKKDIN
jgi:hypothetical protein